MESQTYVRVIIPTSQEFLKQWHVWVHGKVAKHFKRDQERIPDLAQRARLRLLSKDFVFRWFFKHLTNDLVDANQASAMLGGTPVRFLGQISPAFGSRNSPDAMWRISDVLVYAKFDYERFFYSIQNHTVETEKVMKLMGLGITEGGKWAMGEASVATINSLFRQGKLRPSEFTEHECVENNARIPHLAGKCGILGCVKAHFCRGFCSTHYASRRTKKCSECEEGRKSLNDRRISLSHDWNDRSAWGAIKKLRWNDSQLKPYLRNWNNSNKIFSLPRYIMRLPDEATIDAGLLKYANMIIDNDVVNAFKSFGRNEDKNRSDSDGSDVDLDIVTAKEAADSAIQPECDEDPNIHSVEDRKDIADLIREAMLTEDEASVITKIDLEGYSTKELANHMKLTPGTVSRLRQCAIGKMRRIACSA